MAAHDRGAGSDEATSPDGGAVALEQVAEGAADPMLGPDGRLELIIAAEQVRAAGLRPREAQVLGLRVSGCSRGQMAELTGDSYRSVDRQLVRAQRRLADARRGLAEVG